MAIIRIEVRAYFNDSTPDFSDRFPDGYSLTPYVEVIDQQNAIGWDHFVRGKLSTEWKRVQYIHAKRYGMKKQSEGWVCSLIKLMANMSFQLWELRNKCRHGHDEATRQQSVHEQTQREIRCLYLLKPHTLLQDQGLFRATVKEHLTEKAHQLRTWIVHNKKLILYSVRVPKAQAQLATKSIQRFFPSRGTRQSVTISTRSSHAPRRHRITRVSQFFPAIVQPSAQRCHLSTISEDTELTTNAPLRRFMRRRQLNIPDLFPDHPG
jgi:hypothetical protein